MKLSDLPARELARLDAVCLEYESRIRDSLGDEEKIRQIGDEIESLVQRYGGQNEPLLRTELQGILKELQENGAHAKLPAHAHAASIAATNNLPSRSTPAAVNTASTEGFSDVAVSRDIPETPESPRMPEPPKSATPSADLPALGSEIGPYLLTSILGRGGMGIVYRATDTRLDRSVAIKMLALDDRQSHSLIERFQREAKAVAGLTHPHIVELFDIGVFGGKPYVVMEHLRGETLLQRMQTERVTREPITVAQVRNWGGQLADALATAHSGGVIHRDLKPENVMVMARPHSAGSRSANADITPTIAPGQDAPIPEGETSLKLFDFGLSRFGSSGPVSLHDPARQEAPRLDSDGVSSRSQSLSPPDRDSDSDPDSDRDSATRVGAILGTPGYMAPEQARGGVITPAADVFALGCVLYEAFFGRPAFAGETATKRFSAVLEKQPLADPARRRDDVALSDLILSMLNKKPADRPTAAAVAGQLQSDAPGKNTPRRSGSGHGSPSRSPLRRATASDPDDGDALVVSRRRLVELIGGAIAGGLLGATLLPASASGQLRSIRSIGVLRFQNAASLGDASESIDQAIGARELDQGELLSGLLVNELTRIEGITVPKYVPIIANLPAEFRDAARMLEVDALVTGTFAYAQNESETLTANSPSGGDDSTRRIMTVNLEIISGKTGDLIQGITIPTAAGDNLIEQSALAGELAEVIDRELSEGDDRPRANAPDAFTCLVKGRTISDPDTVSGMRKALDCFNHAAEVDYNYAQAHAGVALTSISLAAREPDEKASLLIAASQQATSRALLLSPTNSDALLAEAMLNYQILADFDAADDALDELTRTSPNHWQVHHQAGWLKIIQLEDSQGMQLMRRAAGLHPASRFLKTDLARAEWFRGNADRAIQSAIGLIGSGPTTPEKNEFARGLLIDIYEHSGNLDDAAKTDPKIAWIPGDERNAYFTAREKRLAEIPYGPYGPTINAAILQIRRTDLLQREPPNALLARLIAAQLPMLPLVLCKHPAMISMTLLDQATETYSVLRFG